MSSNYIDLPEQGGGGGGGITSLNSLTGVVDLIAGPSITITTIGNDIQIASSALPTALISLNGSTFANQTMVVGTAGSDFNIADSAPGIHTFNLPTASSSVRGALSSADWTTFNSKQPALTPGSISTTTSGVTIGNGASSTVGPNVTVNIQTATGSLNGLLSSTDWNTFNNKQPAGSYITSLTGDVVASGPGAAAASVQRIQGTPVDATNPLNTQFLVYNSGTSRYFPVAISGDATMANTGALTLANTAVTPGSYTLTNLTVDSKGRLTAAASGTVSLTTQVTGILPIANGGTNNTSYTAGSIIFSNGTSLAQDNAALFWNDTNQSIGIGTNTPASNTFIDTVNTTGAAKRIQLTGYGVSSNVGYRSRFARGTSVSPAAAQSGDILNFFSGQGYGASQFPTASTGVLNVIAGETFTNTSNQTYVTINATPTGSVTSAEAFRVTSTGVTLGPPSSSTAVHAINGGLNRTNKTISANYAVDTTTSDDIIYCNAAGGITVTLPTPASGRTLVIKDISGNATTNNITIARHASESIEGIAASYLIQVSYGTTILSSDGTNWWVIG